MSENKPDALFDLGLKRIFQLHDRNRKFTITCNPPSRKDWFNYFDGVVISSEQLGDGRSTSVDIDTARTLLAEQTVASVEGYVVAGNIPLQNFPNWQSRLPLAHRRQIGSLLSDARPSEETGELIIHPETEIVTIDATYGLIDNKMVKFTGLVHDFKVPTAQQFKRYNQENSRSIVVGGSRTGKTIYPSTQRLLCELYDELILGVDGSYAFKGAMLDTPAQIREEMDCFHKFIAAQQLFNPASSVTAEAPAE